MLVVAECSPSVVMFATDRGPVSEVFDRHPSGLAAAEIR